MDPLRIQSVIEANPTIIGLAIIITNDYKSNPQHRDLLATESDGVAMEDAFKHLGFATIRKHNVTLSLVIALLHQCSSVRYPQTCKRLAFVFAGHGREPQQQGEEGTQLVTCEGKSFGVKTVVTKLSPQSSDSTLGSMARMFFIDACRGSRDDYGRLVSRGGGIIADIRIPSEASNFILCYSTVSGYRSYEVQKGETGPCGIWLPLVAQKLKTSEKNIEGVMTDVNKELKEQFQDRQKYPCMMQPEIVLRLNETINLMNECKLTDGATSNSSSQSFFQTEPSSLLPLPSSNLSRTLNHTSQETLPLPTQQLPPECQQVEQPPKSKIAAIFPGQAISHSCSLEYPMLPPSICLPHQSLPAVYNQATVSTNSGGLVHRQGDTCLDSGHYRGKLNQYCQRNVIKPSFTSSWRCDGTYDANLQRNVYRATVECVLFNGQIVRGDSKQYYDGKKAIAQEQAAKDAIEQIDHIVKTSMPQNTPTPPAPSLSLNHPLHALPDTNTSQSIPSPSNPPNNVYKQELNNYFQGQLRKELPTYKSEMHFGGFICHVSHPYFQTLFGKDYFVGNVCATKKEAENSAAWRAWTRIMPR